MNIYPIMTVEASSIWAWRGAEDWSSDQVCAVSGEESYPSQSTIQYEFDTSLFTYDAM